MKRIIAFLLCLLSLSGYSQTDSFDPFKSYSDSVEATLNYQKGKIILSNNIGTIDVPPGFLYLDGANAEVVLHNLWGNPKDSESLGMLVPENIKVTAPEGWAFILTFDELGYVKDGDADEIDYDELLSEIKADTEESNKYRIEEGYEAISLVGWASKPFYDKDKKVLHWAKELKFGDSEENTLNYNVRILGRKGVVVLNAVSSINQLEEVKSNISPVMASFQYSDGNRYSDFNPDIDEVAAWTIGGLVAGKMLAKVGFFAIFLKYIKFIGLALMGLGGAAWKWFKKRTETQTVRTLEGENQAPS